MTRTSRPDSPPKLSARALRTFKLRMAVRLVLCSIVLWETLTAPFAGAVVAVACGALVGWACEKGLDWRSKWDASRDADDRLRAKAEAARKAEAERKARIEAEWAREKEAQRAQPGSDPPGPKRSA